jgi:hypothetical protein
MTKGALAGTRRNAPREGLNVPTRCTHPTLAKRSTRSAEAREILVQLQRVGLRATEWVGSKRWLCSGLLIRRDEGSIPSRPTSGSPNALRAPTAIQNTRSPRETAKQMKCCGDTPVRHTGVGGFNSPHLLSDRNIRLKCDLELATGRIATRGSRASSRVVTRRHSIKCGPGRSAQALGFHPN